LLARLPDFDRGGISHLIAVSCTGFPAPGVDFHLQKPLALSPALFRFHSVMSGEKA
jgi:predicted naringenin-chalcone synthase